MGNLCSEVSERLAKDQKENDRMAKSLHVSLSQENGGHASRCGPLYSYDPVKMTKQVCYISLNILYCMNSIFERELSLLSRAPSRE